MSVSITITPAVVALAVYIVGALMTASAFCLDEMSFVNPSYGRAILSGLAWPLLVVQVLILAPVFGFYIGDFIRELRQ